MSVLRLPRRFERVRPSSVSSTKPRLRGTQKVRRRTRKIDRRKYRLGVPPLYLLGIHSVRCEIQLPVFKPPSSAFVQSKANTVWIVLLRSITEASSLYIRLRPSCNEHQLIAYDFLEHTAAARRGASLIPTFPVLALHLHHQREYQIRFVGRHRHRAILI